MIAFKIIVYETAVSLTKEKQAMNSISQLVHTETFAQTRKKLPLRHACSCGEWFRLTLNLNLDLYGNYLHSKNL